MTFKDKINQFQSYNKDWKDFRDKYNTFTQVNKISPEEANALRHISASMYFANKYGINAASGLGTLNEIIPGNSFSETGDTKVDLYNNHIGRVQSQYYDTLTPEQALLEGINLIKNTNKAALKNNDKRALNFQYPATTWQKIVGTLKN